MSIYIEFWRPKHLSNLVSTKNVPPSGPILDVPPWTKKNLDKISAEVNREQTLWMRLNGKLALVLQAPVPVGSHPMSGISMQRVLAVSISGITMATAWYRRLRKFTPPWRRLGQRLRSGSNNRQGKYWRSFWLPSRLTGCPIASGGPSPGFWSLSRVITGPMYIPWADEEVHLRCVSWGQCHHAVLFDGHRGATIESVNPFPLRLSPKMLNLCGGGKGRLGMLCHGVPCFVHVSLVEFALVMWPGSPQYRSNMQLLELNKTKLIQLSLAISLRCGLNIVVLSSVSVSRLKCNVAGHCSSCFSLLLESVAISTCILISNRKPLAENGAVNIFRFNSSDLRFATTETTVANTGLTLPFSGMRLVDRPWASLCTASSVLAKNWILQPSTPAGSSLTGSSAEFGRLYHML